MQKLIFVIAAFCLLVFTDISILSAGSSIDIRGASVTITGADTLTMTGVYDSSLGKTVRMDLKWKGKAFVVVLRGIQDNTDVSNLYPGPSIDIGGASVAITGTDTLTMTDVYDSFRGTTVWMDLRWKGRAFIVVSRGLQDDTDDAECGAYVAPGVWKEFDCYNLAAIGKTRGDDPFTPSWSLIGGYWRWGRKGPDESQWYDTNTSNFVHGPTGSGPDDANDGEIDQWWDTYSAGSSEWYAADGAWSDDEKTENDPCPPGYRVPTATQWEGVDGNNSQSMAGTWSTSATNYSSGRFFGDNLMLPAAGYRLYYSASLKYRGSFGCYWSSTEYPGYYSLYAWNLYFYDDNAYTSWNLDRSYGFTVRCVAE